MVGEFPVLKSSRKRSANAGMAKLCTLLSFLLFPLLLEGVECGKIVGAYFSNSGQYRPKPYTCLPENLERIVGRLDYLMYAFAYFNPDNYTIEFTDTNDQKFIRQIMKYKVSYPDLKILISVGGADFPSANFSEMASTSAGRAAFISNLQSFISLYNFDGVDINWEFPCSPPKTIYMKYFCTSFLQRHDNGGNCTEEASNFLLLVKQMRDHMGKDILITVAGSAFSAQYNKLDLKSISKYINYWHVKTYDYTVSATNTSFLTRPSAPLQTGHNASGAAGPWSVNNTVAGYLSAGVAADKIIPGIPLYGHAWYVPGINGTQWQQFGLRSSIQGLCCGPLKHTYGAKYGKGSQRCGTYMYSEITATGAAYYFDNETHTAIGYQQQNSIDGWTKAGTWFSYNDRSAVQATTKFINKVNLGGAFVFDVSQDSIDFSTGDFTYQLTETVYLGLKGSSSGHICDPQVGCTVCELCCKPFLTNQFDCNACVIINCGSKHVSYSCSSVSAECNVCHECCASHVQTQRDCNQCVQQLCHSVPASNLLYIGH